MTINTSYSEELHQPASTTRKLAMSFNGVDKVNQVIIVLQPMALLHSIIQVELSIVVMYQIDLLLVQIFKLVIFQQLIQKKSYIYRMV